MSTFLPRDSGRHRVQGVKRLRLRGRSQHIGSCFSQYSPSKRDKEVELSLPIGSSRQSKGIIRNLTYDAIGKSKGGGVVLRFRRVFLTAGRVCVYTQIVP